MKNQNEVENEMNIHNNKDLTLLSVLAMEIHTFMRTYVCRSCQCGKKSRRQKNKSSEWIEPVLAYKYPPAAHTVQLSFEMLANWRIKANHGQQKSLNSIMRYFQRVSLNGVSVSASVRIFLSLHDNKRAQSVLHTVWVW